MRHLRWLLLFAAIAPWCFFAFGETPKKSKSAAKKTAQPADLQSLPESERRAFLLEKIADDQRKKQEEKRKEERSAALKSAAKLEASLKSASPDEKPAILYELGVTHSTRF